MGFFSEAKASLKIGKMGFKWINLAKDDPGDNGQINARAMSYVQLQNIAPEDAWLLSLTEWVRHHPEKMTQLKLAKNLQRFLDLHEGRIPLSAASILNARGAAEKVIHDSEALMRSDETYRRGYSGDVLKPSPAIKAGFVPSSYQAKPKSTPPSKAKHLPWTMSRSTGILTHRKSGRTFESERYFRDESGVIKGFQIRDSEHVWVNDNDIEDIP
jgi:hypothetical protein